MRQLNLWEALAQENSQLLGPVRAKDEDAFDISRSTWTGDKGNETGIIPAVFFLQQRKCIGQIRDQLVAPSEYDVMRRKDR